MPSHAESRVLPYTPEQLFDLVADVASYPEFLPWCVAARILNRCDSVLRAELAIGFKGIRERFVSRVSLDRPTRRIHVSYEDGPFKYLENSWHFEPHAEGACRLGFHVDFEFRSRMLEAVMGRLFNEAVRRMVQAFEARAADLYGDSSPLGAQGTALQPGTD